MTTAVMAAVKSERPALDVPVSSCPFALRLAQAAHTGRIHTDSDFHRRDLQMGSACEQAKFFVT